MLPTLIPVDTAAFEFPDLHSSNTGSSSALKFLVHKYGDSIKRHSECRKRSGSPVSYPSRLLHVGSLDDGHISVQATTQSAIS